jgi:hypothetical protein
MADNKAEVINNYPGHYKTVRRTRPSGKERVTIEFKSEPLGILTDERALAMTIAAAVAEDIRVGIRSIGAFAKAATQLARKRAQKAFAEGERWARKRYGGGRIGDTPPAQTMRDLNDSGRLARGITAMPTKDASTVVVNVPANRLNNPEVYAATWPKLKPVIDAAMKGPRVVEAAKKVARDLVRKARMSERDQARELVDKLGQTFEKFAQLSREVEDLSDE